MRAKYCARDYRQQYFIHLLPPWKIRNSRILPIIKTEVKVNNKLIKIGDKATETDIISIDDSSEPNENQPEQETTRLFKI